MPSDLTIDATYVPPSYSPTEVLSSNPVSSLGLITGKDPEEDPGAVLPTQFCTLGHLATSITLPDI